MEWVSDDKDAEKAAEDFMGTQEEAATSRRPRSRNRQAVGPQEMAPRSHLSRNPPYLPAYTLTPAPMPSSCSPSALAHCSHRPVHPQAPLRPPFWSLLLVHFQELDLMVELVFWREAQSPCLESTCGLAVPGLGTSCHPIRECLGVVPS